MTWTVPGTPLAMGTATACSPWSPTATQVEALAQATSSNSICPFPVAIGVPGTPSVVVTTTPAAPAPPLSTNWLPPVVSQVVAVGQATPKR